MLGNAKCSIKKRGNVRITYLGGAFLQPFLQWKSSKYYILLECVCSLNYPVQKAHASYYISICDLSSFPYFSTLSIKRHDLREGGSLDIKCALFFSTTFVANISHSKNR